MVDSDDTFAIILLKYGLFVGALILLVSSIAMLFKKQWSRIAASIGLHLIVISFWVAYLFNDILNLEVFIYIILFTCPPIIILLLLHNKKLN